MQNSYFHSYLFNEKDARTLLSLSIATIYDSTS